MKPHLTILGLATLLGLAIPAAQAAPVNDAFASAIALNGPVVTTTGSNVGATKDFRAGEPSITGNFGGANVWWTWTATASGLTTIDTQGSDFNTLLGAYTGTAANALTVVAQNDNFEANQWSRVQFNAVAGTVYRILIDGFRVNFQSQPAQGNITLNVKGPGGVTIDSPTNGAVLTIGEPIPVVVTIATNFPSPPASRVDFYRNGVLFATDTTEPFSAIANNTPAGSNTFSVIAVNSGGTPIQSPAVNVLVQDIGVILLTPADGTIFASTNAITVTAWAYLPVGTITNVEFVVDGVKFGEDATAPFSASWTNVSGGSHRITAVMRSGAGASYTSQPIYIGVATTLVPLGSVWSYLDNGSNQGTNWIAPDFDESGWTNGPTELGYGDGDEARVVEDNVTPGYVATDQDRYITTYFRRAFVVPPGATFSSLTLALERDDAGVVYLNGREVLRSPNLPAAPTVIDYLTLATGQGIEDTIDTVSLATTNLVAGTNVFAVEIHQQAASSSDISFNLQLTGLPNIIRNQSPSVALTNPIVNAYFLAPATIPLDATASDADGTVAKVEFFADGVKLGEDTSSPYALAWNNPPVGAHVLHAVATDDQGATETSAQIPVVVYDAAGWPVAKITSPADGVVMEGPTNLILTATANAIGGVTNVQFLSNGVLIGNDDASPYSVVWSSNFGSNGLVVVASDSNGARGTSAVVSVRITIPPTNTVAPSIAAQLPAAASTVTNLTTIQVTFSERVSGVDASDLLVNGVAATNVVGSESNYTFAVVQPAYGAVNITWASGHGIEDFGFPSNLPFDATGPGATWIYQLVDRTPPTIAARVPAAGTTVTNLTQITVTFSEAVSGVDAWDLLVNGTPAFGFSDNGSTYTFAISQPAAGTVNVSWDVDHGISDLAASPNSFNHLAAGAAWSFTLDTRTTLVQSNSTWLYVKGTTEAASPPDAWRTNSFDDSGWTNGATPFVFGEASLTNATIPGTSVADMANNGYSSIYLRRKFVVTEASVVTNLLFNHQSDDGFIAWINGVEVLRYNMPAGEVAYNGSATAATTEPGNAGSAYIVATLPDPSGYLVSGTNILAVHAFNVVSANPSSDFSFNGQLYTFIADPSVVAPRLASVTPGAGTVLALTNITMRFTEGVSGVGAADLLVNGVPATSVASTTNTTYTFSFAQPPFGTVNVTWAAGHGIADFDAPPKPFDGSGAITYTFLNPSAPTVASQAPVGGATINNLTQLSVTFSESVTGVNASDLLVSGVPATGISGGPSTYTFTFPQPAYGAVAIGWAADAGITDLEPAANAFDPARSVNTWSYPLVDQTPPTLVTKNPPAGQVLNLTSITVGFSEAVTGVNALDLLINGGPASTVSGGPSTYTFTFPQPNATVVNVTWANAHGIRDLAPVPNSFDATAPGATWTYTTLDNLAPEMVVVDPPPGATIRSLSQISVTFSENVTGVGTNDLLLNSRFATQVSGSGAGPYTFNFLPASNGLVEVAWVPGHGIADLAAPPNAFAGGQWTYDLDPDASFAGSVVINEIMFNPPSGRPADEWLELRNVTASPINLAGWRFTRGVDFTFPNASIPAGGYIVVAADVLAFQAKYPGGANLVGGWTGRLANSDETLELVTALGEAVNRVHYASQGDWARREHVNGSMLVESIVLNGTTATVTHFDHGYTAGDQVLISGADQPEYNGRFVVGGVANSTFTITVAGSPASPATGTIIGRQVVDDAFTGWSWFSTADGFGSSIELVNSAMPNTAGQNWLSSTNAGGTPGASNSVATTNIAPLLSDVTHFPPVPRSTDPVAITARVRDELSNGIASVTLFYRNHTAANPGAFLSTNMFDDGAHSDGLGQDGLYGAALPAAANRAVFEFYVQATDNTGLSRTWPAPAWETNSTFVQLANALYQVDDEVITNLMPAIRVVISGTEDAIFPPTDRDTDAEMNATFISTDGDGTKVRYRASVRIRGAGSRTQTTPNNRVNIPSDDRWNGLSAINLNSQYIHAQVMGAALARKSGLPASPARLIQYRVNGVNGSQIAAPGTSGRGDGYGTFLMLNPVNGDLAADLFPDDGDGNVYRASKFPHDADLNYQGTDPSAYLLRGYFKTSNQSENDWNDMFNLTRAFSQVVSDADYLEAMSTNVNVRMWMRFFAVGTLLNYTETSMFNGRGDDYALYRGMKDPRFVVIGHDFDTVLGQGDTTTAYASGTNSSIYIMLSPPNTGGNAPNMPLLRRFFTNANFAPIFFSELKRLADTAFNPAELNPLVDEMLTGWGNGPTTVTINAMKNHAANRRANVLAQIPLTLTVSTALALSNGLPYTTTANAILFGVSHAIDTRKVLVNGEAATWAAWDARWTNSVSLRPGINRVLVQSLDSNNVEFARATLDVWFDDGSVQTISGALATDTVLTAANGPHQITAHLTVNAGITLTILPGTTVQLASGVNITVANGGRIVADGTDTQRIRFTRIPGGANWGGITINGGAGSPTNRFAYVQFENNGSTAIDVNAGDLVLSHSTFANTAAQYLSLDGASFLVEDCHFPNATAQFEPIHGTQGIKAGGRGLFLRNFVGRPVGYNDSIDFTGGNRPGPIVQVIGNVFPGSDDDILDFDSTDAWIEGNIFLHIHRNGSPDSASAISGGSDNADNSQITIVGNLFYDVDHVANAKQTNFYTLLNNTIVHQTKVGSQDTNTAVVILADMNESGVFTSQGAGVYLEGNIILDAENLTRHVTTALVTYTNNLIHQLTGAAWTGPGGNNVVADPLFQYLPQMSETTNFTSWAQAQVMWDWFSLRTGSPASGAGPNGRDLGGVSPSPLNGERAGVRGVSISGEPIGATPSTTATLTVGVNRTGSGIPTAGFPNGSGFTHYKWRLDGGAWSAETSIATRITLNGLSAGQHFVEVTGKNDAGYYQDDPAFGASAVVTTSRTWTVNPAASPLRLTEVLAANSGALIHNGTTPDAIEIYNDSGSAFDLAGLRLTDDPQNPDKFIFPAGASIPAKGYLVVFADNPNGTPGHHLGFNLGQLGDAVYLFDSASRSGALLDSVEFGLQLTDLSIGRVADGSWALTQPTLGAPNRAAQTGDPRALHINEWLALGTTPFDNDFIELFNGDALPVALGGLFLTDELIGRPDRHRIAPLSFMKGLGYQRFVADGNTGAGVDHVNFSLSGDYGEIGLFLPDLRVIDCVVFQPQRLNVSQGRSPNGGSAIVYFDTPTPGAPNPLVTVNPQGGALVLNEVLANNASLAEAGRTPDWIELYNGTTNMVSLADFSLTDDSLQPRRFVFPAGTSLTPAARLRVWCDPGSTNVGTLLTTNFALKATGGAVYLFDAMVNGGSLLSAVTYGLQAADFSIGRVPDGSTNWVLNTPTPDAANAAVPTLGIAANLKVNEWLADPAPGNDDWFEIYNPNPLPVALGGLHLTDDLNNRTKHKIPALSFMGTGTNAWQRFVADGNTGAGADHVSFSLRAAGEAVGLSTEAGTLIDGYVFGQQIAEVSAGRFPDGSTNVVSFAGTVSPGESNWRMLTSVVINEVLTHTDVPLEDAIELHNLTAAPIDVGGWWLSDDNGTLQKYQIPSPTVIPANGFAVIYETVFTNNVFAAIPFALSSKGDEVVLSASTNGALTGWRARQDFGAQANGVSFGRHVTSDQREEFVAMSGRTFGKDDAGSVEEFRTGTGASNTYPRVGPVVISEIMYHPPDIGTNDNTRDEFIELQNITTARVDLYDASFPANTWHLRDAVDFDFPSGTSIAPGDYLLVVGFDPVANTNALAAFRSRYSIPAGTAIVGPYSGKLANDTDDLELRRPDAPNLGDVPYVLVESVRYFDTTPWPALADGTGFSLQRVSVTGFGDDPVNWTAASPTPGPQASLLDTDGDGMPDSWETANGFDRFNPADAALDHDGDGLTNIQESQMGTDPRDAQSGVRITSIAMAVDGANIVLTFTAFANQSYTLESAPAANGPWLPFRDFAAAPATYTAQVTIPATGAAQFFRLRTPWRLVPAAGLGITSAQPLPGNQMLLLLNLPANQPGAVEFKPSLGAGLWNEVTNYPATPNARVVPLTVPAGGSSGFYRMRSP